jgi:hypothetical protein
VWNLDHGSRSIRAGIKLRMVEPEPPVSESFTALFDPVTADMVLSFCSAPCAGTSTQPGVKHNAMPHDAELRLPCDPQRGCQRRMARRPIDLSKSLLGVDADSAGGKTRAI